MLMDLNEDYIRVFVRKFAVKGCDLQLHIL